LPKYVAILIIILNCISLCAFVVGCTDRVASVAGNLEYVSPVFQVPTNQINHSERWRRPFPTPTLNVP